MLNDIVKNFNSINLDEMRPAGFMLRRDQEIKLCIKNVNDRNGFVSIGKCPICSSDERIPLFNKMGFIIYQCLNCTVGYVNQFPVNTTDVYSNVDYLGIAKNDYLKNIEYRKKRFGKERIQLINKYIQNEKKKSRLLDIGCGIGWFLETAKDAGYSNIYGLEYGSELASFTAKRLDINVWPGSLYDLNANEKFDVITLFDVIEHIPNPKMFIEAVKKHLNKNGIVVIFTPNFDSYGFSIVKEHLSLVTPAEHLFYFNKKSLNFIFETVGLEVISFETKGMDIPDVYAYYKEILNNNEVAEFLKNNTTILQSIIDQAGCANHMRFIVRN